jgi:hypothetical protein
MLTEPTQCGLWITWRGLQCEAALGLVHPEQTTLQTILINEDCVVVEVLTVYTIFADALVEYPPNNEVMKLGQEKGQRLQWRRCRIDIKGAPTCKSPPHETTRPTPQNESAQNNHAKADTSRPNTSIIAPSKTPLLPVNQGDVLVGADKSIDDISKKVVGISGPNTAVIPLSETPLDKKALEKPSAILNQQGKKLAENKISTPRTVGKKSLEKSSAISKLQEEKLAKNKSSTPPTAGKQALKKPSSSITKQQEKKMKIVVNKTSKMPTTKRSVRDTKKNPCSNPKQSKRDT